MMNYSFIDSDRPLPSFFKPIGISVAFISLFIGLFLKFSSVDSIFEISNKGFQLIYFSALIIIQFSRAKIEDERTEELKLQIMRFGYRMMLFSILLFSIASTKDVVFRVDIFFIYIISILGFQIVLYALLDYNAGIHVFRANKSLYNLSCIILLVGLFYFNQWIWLS